MAVLWFTPSQLEKSEAFVIGGGEIYKQAEAVTN